MRRKRWLIALFVLVVLIWGAKVLLLDLATGPGEPYKIDLAALHKAAISQGPLPSSIEVEHVADFGFPRTLVVAGDGFQTHRMVMVAHRVVWPDRTILIDAAMSPEDGKSIPGNKFDAAGYARVQKALKSAAAVIFTHEHPDHVGGVARASDFDALASHVLMTREQFDGPRLERDKFAPGRLEKLKPLDYSGLYVAAPGVVLQKAPGHSTGTQLIYVELASGAQYLFVGDIAWTEDNVRLQRGRPGIVTLLGKEDRAAVASQLAALAKLPPSVHMVVAHDPKALARDLAAGLFKRGFSD